MARGIIAQTEECPVCDSKNTEEISEHPDASSWPHMFWENKCHDCGAEFTETYLAVHLYSESTDDEGGPIVELAKHHDVVPVLGFNDSLNGYLQKLYEVTKQCPLNQGE